MDIYKDYDIKGKRVSPETARQIRSQLNKNHNEHALDKLKSTDNNRDYKLKMELEQLMYELNKVSKK
jgi:hypothetical protein